MNPLNPNAAPFQPGMTYQQSQQSQNTYASTAAPANPPYGQDRGASNSKATFSYNPFGYNYARNSSSNNYQQQQVQQQQPHRQSYSTQAPAGAGYYGNGGNPGGPNLVHQPPTCLSYQRSNGYQQQNTQVVVSHPPPASCSTYYSPAYNTQANQPYIQDQGMDQFSGQPTFNNQIDDMVYETIANVVGGVATEGDFAGPELGLPPQYNLSHDLLTKMQTNPNGSSLFEIQIGLEQLIYESQEFDTWASAIRDRLTSQDFTKDDQLLACSIIVQMAVLIADCQYNFSRLCQFLNQNIPYFATECLIPVLEEFSYSNSSFMEVVHAKHLLQFLAELYDKIEVDKVKSLQLSSLLGEQINQLLKQKCDPSNESITALIKAVVQALKLVGRFLESGQGPDVLDDIFKMLNEFCNRSEVLSESVKGQVLALTQLRANQWGVTNIEQSSSSNPTSSSNVMIIGPDGNPLSEEECAFLDDNYDVYDNSPAGSWNGNGALEEDEVLEDYEKFLQATAIRAAEKALEKISFDDDDDYETYGSPKLSSFPSSTDQKTPGKESETKQ